MIVFDLRCDQHHAFECWFASSAAFETQRDTAMIACPYCGSAKVEKAVMAPRVAAKSNAGRSSPAERQAMIAKLARVQQSMLKDSTWVGDGFAGKARAMAEGTETPATIHGSATPDDTKALRDDGIGVMPLLFPVVPPESLN